MCGRFSLEPAHVILALAFLLGAKFLDELDKFDTEKKILFFIIPCQDSIQEFGDGSNQKFYRG